MKFSFMSASTEVSIDYHVFINQFVLCEDIVCLSTLKYFLFDCRVIAPVIIAGFSDAEK